MLNVTSVLFPDCRQIIEQYGKEKYVQVVCATPNARLKNSIQGRGYFQSLKLPMLWPREFQGWFIGRLPLWAGWYIGHYQQLLSTGRADAGDHNRCLQYLYRSISRYIAEPTVKSNVLTFKPSYYYASIDNRLVSMVRLPRNIHIIITI